MKYPAPVQERVDFLDEYEINNRLKEFLILHLYPGELAYPHGYYDARWFQLWGYNQDVMQKRDLGQHDGAVTFGDGVTIKGFRIFADGSTSIAFQEPVRVILAQAVILEHT